MMLRQRLWLNLLLTFLVISSGAGLVLSLYQIKQTQKSISLTRADLKVAADVKEKDITDMIFGGLWPAAGDKLDTLMAFSPRISVGGIYDPAGTLRHSKGDGFEPPDEHLSKEAMALLTSNEHPTIRREAVGRNGWVVEYYRPLMFSGRVQGYLYLAQSLADVERQRKFMLGGTAALLLTLLLALGLLTGRFLQRNIVKRLSGLAGLMRQAVSAELDVKYVGTGEDEIASIGDSFNTMVVGLREREFIKSTFGSYVSPEVVRRMLEGGQSVLHGQRRRVTVLFSDIRGFTTMSESLAPEAVVTMLNEYMNWMSTALSARGGRIDKFIGDAIMADWGALEEVADHERRAAGAAVDMLRALRGFNAARAAEGHRPVHIGIGLNTGDVIAGTIGSAEKLEFTVIGDTVNLASRLEALCKVYGAQIVASTPVWEAVRGAYPGRQIDHVIVKGKDASTKLYEIFDPDDPRVARIPAYDEAMQLYLTRRFEEAAKRFDESRAGADDPVSQFQIDRCLALAKDPPGPDWDGVIRREK